MPHGLTYLCHFISPLLCKLNSCILRVYDKLLCHFYVVVLDDNIFSIVSARESNLQTVVDTMLRIADHQVEPLDLVC